jgi:hypothetical protein
MHREAMEAHPVEVMNYAARHDYTDLLDDAAPLSLDIPLPKIAELMDIELLPDWVRPCYLVQASIY